MRVIVNGASRNVADGATVEDVVREVRGDAARSGVAVARNGEVVARAAWAHVKLAEEDRIEVLAAVQGG